MPLAPALWVAFPGSVGWTASLSWQCRPSQIAASWSSWPAERGEVAASVQSNAHISKPIRRSRCREPPLNLSSTDEDDSFHHYEAKWEDVEAINQQEMLPSLDRPQKVGMKKVNKIGQGSHKAGSRRAGSSNVQQQNEPAVLAWADADFERSKLNPRMSATSVKRGVVFPGRRLSTKEWEKQVHDMVKQQKYQDATTLKDSTQTRSQLVPQTAQTVAKPPRKLDSLRAPKYDSDISKIEDDARFEYLRMQLGLESNWRPLVEYLFTLGVSNEDFQKIAQRHKACLQLNVDAVKGRVEFLGSLDIRAEVLKKLLVRHPQVIEYRVESLKPRLDYLKSLGIPESSLGKVITVAPSILEYNLRNSLQPRVKFLREVVGIRAADLPKVVTRSPQVLTQSIEESLEPQVDFFLQEIKITEAALAKIITRHPQVLHYSVEDGIRPRITFLKSIGMSEQDIVKVLTRMTQVLSLSVENSLKPKYEYLVKELKGGVRTVVSFPAYFSLSLEQRIKPRHQFLITLQKSPKGPFPMKCLAVTDEYFCSHWAKASLKDYHAFRDALLLRSFAEKFERKNTVQL